MQDLTVNYYSKQYSNSKCDIHSFLQYSIIINNRNLVVSRKKRNISQILSNNNISRGSSGGSGYGRYVRGRKNSR